MEMLRLSRLGRVAAAAAILVALVAVPASAEASTVTVHARMGPALGVIPSVAGPDIAVGANVPEAYHGGPVMHAVRVHTIFWAPPGYRFDGPPSSGTLGYEAMVQRFFGDVSRDSGQTGNVFSILREYGDNGGVGGYNIAYNPATDSVDAAEPYPSVDQQCASPNGVATCVTDVELQQEIDHVIQAQGGGARGLGNLWLIFLPPNVDTCVFPGSCASNAYAGYHSVSNLDHGVTIYAVLPDPLVELPLAPGADPQGNPDAEETVIDAAHETIEAMTDPEGTGWMDPNGMENADKCEVGPQLGTPLGYAPNGSPYNELIGGEEWLIQEIWSNVSRGCVQTSKATPPAPSLPQVHLTQFSPWVRGNIGAATAHVSVTVTLTRTGTLVAGVRTSTRSDGSWGPVRIRSLTRSAEHAFGDDRDTVRVTYGNGGPPRDTILTGNGGNPFTESGWTGWYDLDHGSAVFSAFGVNGVLVSPCFQTGVLSLEINGVPTPSPTDLCGTETDVAIDNTAAIGPGALVTLQSQDNRAVTAGNPAGALVTLGVSLGEANSVGPNDNNQIIFPPTGFPSCTANLRSQRVSCTGLVPSATYLLGRRRGHATVRARADGNGSIAPMAFPGRVPLTGGDVVTLTGAAHRALTTLHVAHLRVHLLGAQTVVASGTCQAGDYYGPAPSSPPVNAAAGAPGIAGSGRICPPDGSARGLPARGIEQTDDLSGGETFTTVPELQFTSPSDGATLYGPFVALASAGIPTPRHAVLSSGARVSVTITAASGGPPVFHAGNVAVSGGVRVRGLAAGAYTARWVLTDAAGDTRAVVTHFVEAG